jgi:hypothetical protein
MPESMATLGPSCRIGDESARRVGVIRNLDWRKACVNLGGAQFGHYCVISHLSVYRLVRSFLVDFGGLST